MRDSELLVKPAGSSGKVIDITPQSAGWQYVGFSVYRLEPGQVVEHATDSCESIFVLVEGKAVFSCKSATSQSFDQSFGELGDRMDVFEQKPAHCLYSPAQHIWRIEATSPVTIGACSAPAKDSMKHRKPTVIGPNGITPLERGEGTNLRYIYPIAMEERDVADSLLVTEVYTPAGNWSSYPPHRHDEADFPRITYLEETYYHRLNPAQGFGMQRVYTDDGTLDETISFNDGEVVLVPKGYHPVGAPHGYTLYYLNVMAGPERKWRFINHPDHAWIVGE